MSKIIRSLTALCWLSCMALPVHAQQSYDSMTQDALDEYNAGRWDEAYVLFSKMHELRPSARTQRGMGLAAFEGRRYVLAIRHMRAALSDKNRPLSDEQRAQLESSLQRALSYVARCTLVFLPEAANTAETELVVDNKPALRDDGKLLVDPGEHELSVRAPGFVPLTRHIRVDPGEDTRLTLELHRYDLESRAPPPPMAATPEPTPPPTAAAPSAALTAPPAHAQDSKAGLRIGAYVAGGVALAAVGAAIGLHVAARGAASDVEKQCAMRCTSEQVNREIAGSGLQTYQTLSFVGWGIAGAGAIAAGVFVYVAGKPERRHVGLAVQPLGLRVGGVF